jgi:hypothetical protein
MLLWNSTLQGKWIGGPMICGVSMTARVGHGRGDRIMLVAGDGDVGCGEQTDGINIGWWWLVAESWWWINILIITVRIE